MIDGVEQHTEVKAIRSASVYGGELAGSIDALMNAFENYKETNDFRLSELEKRGVDDPITEGKLNRLDRELTAQQRTIDNLALKPSRHGFFSDHASSISHRDLQHKCAFEAYVRKGIEADLRCLEGKASSSLVDSDGGYLVPDQLDHEVGRRMTAISQIRSIAAVRKVSGNVYKKIISDTGSSTGWVVWVVDEQRQFIYTGASWMDLKSFYS